MGTTEGAAGLSTQDIERCLDWASMMPGALVPQGVAGARAELAALMAAAERASALAAALTEARAYIGSLDGRELVGAGRALRLDARALLRRLDAALADAGPGAAGARDETAALVRRALVDWCAKYGTEVPAYDDEDAERLIDEWLPGWLDALRAGGAGETEDKSDGD
jgi:hypothetical protein